MNFKPTHDPRRLRMTVRVYPTSTGRIIHNISNEGVSKQPYKQLSVQEAKRSIGKFNAREDERRAMKMRGVPRSERPSKMRFCKEHDIKDVLGSVERMYVSERDDWIWADIVSKKTTKERLREDILQKKIDGISMGYYLEHGDRDYKKIKEISLVEDPDFKNSRVKVVHSATSSQSPPPVNFFTIARFKMEQQQNNNNNAPLTDDADTSSGETAAQVADDANIDFDLNDFNNLSDKEKIEFLKSSMALQANKDKEDAQKKLKAQESAMEEQASEFVNGIELLVDGLDANTDAKNQLGGAILTEAMNNKTFGTTVKLFDATLTKERERAAELERKNRQLAEQLSSMQSNAKNYSLQQARNNSAFKVNHSAGNNSMSRNLFTFLRNKRSTGQMTRDQKDAPTEDSPYPSSSSEPATSGVSHQEEPATKVTHSARKADIHEDYLAVDPRTGCSLASLFSDDHRRSVKFGEGTKQLVIHSAARGSSSSSSGQCSIVNDTNMNGFNTDIALLENVLRGTRDFGDGWNPDDIPNSLLGRNPKQFMLIMSEKRISGNHVSNKSEGIRGGSSVVPDHRALRHDDPSINPHDRRDAGYLSRLCVPISEFGTERTRY